MVMAAPLVAAAGSSLGGMLGKLLMGKDNYSGGGIPGVTVTKQAGKADKMGGIPQVDPSQALEYFKKAAVAQEEHYRTGLQFYQQSLQDAAATIHTAYKKANTVLAPMSFASTAALNEQMKMMGLAPLSNSAAISPWLMEIGSSAGGTIDMQGIRAKMDAAEKIQDPTQRAQAKQDIMSTIKSYQKNINSELSSISKPEKPVLFDLTSKKGSKDDKAMQAAHNQKAQEEYDRQLAAYNKRQDDIAQNASLAKSLDEVAYQFDNSYTDKYEAGYTGDQIQKRIESTPGYQFQVAQGTKAIERGMASRGMLGSGNTLLALPDFGQKLGSNYYQQYMANLGNITAQGSGATMAIANNQIGEGNYIGQTQQLAGQAAMQTETNIGNAIAQAAYSSAQMTYDAAKYNTGLQFTRQTDMMKSKDTASNAALQSATQLGMNAMNQYSNSQQGQGQLLGLQLAQTQANNSTYSMGGMTFPNWTV